MLLLGVFSWKRVHLPGSWDVSACEPCRAQGSGWAAAARLWEHISKIFNHKWCRPRPAHPLGTHHWGWFCCQPCISSVWSPGIPNLSACFQPLPLLPHSDPLCQGTASPSQLTSLTQSVLPLGREVIEKKKESNTLPEPAVAAFVFGWALKQKKKKKLKSELIVPSLNKHCNKQNTSRLGLGNKETNLGQFWGIELSWMKVSYQGVWGLEYYKWHITGIDGNKI